MNYVSRCCKSSKLLKTKFIAICLMSLFTIECQSRTLKNDTNKQQEVYSKLESAVKADLNYPESVKFYNVRKIQYDFDDEDSITYCGEVKEKVPAGGYGEKKRFVYSVEDDKAYIIPNEKPNNKTAELIYSIIWKGKCIKNNYEFVHNKSMYWAKSKLELVNAKKELEELEEEKDERDMLKITENSPEYLKAKEKYESLKKRVNQLTEKLKDAKEKLEEAKDERDMLTSFENLPEYLKAKKKYESLKKRVDQLKKELSIYN